MAVNSHILAQREREKERGFYLQVVRNLILGPQYSWSAFGMYETRTGPTFLSRLRQCQSLLRPTYPPISIRDLTFLVHRTGAWAHVPLFFGIRDVSG